MNAPKKKNKFSNIDRNYLNFSDETDRFIDTDILSLSNTKFPIIFDSVEGECEKSGTDCSPFNRTEVLAVLHWVSKLLGGKWNVSPKEIGIVTPYRAQVRLFQTLLKVKKWDEISVGSAEVYQGQEKSIIIISTVRSDKNLGFVKEGKVSIFEVNMIIF